ncbi:hypothetical protein [Mucilaginibacter sp.]|uniref:hypothetical protein n=1 Tax=Mucilaginibacter sp. TaxID=1882438 RepID=UPI003D0CC54E
MDKTETARLLARQTVEQQQSTRKDQPQNGPISKQQPDKDEASERELLIQNLYQAQLNNNAASEFIRRTAEQQQLFSQQMTKMEAMMAGQQKDQWKQNRMLIWWIAMVAISEIIILVLFVSR